MGELLKVVIRWLLGLLTSSIGSPILSLLVSWFGGKAIDFIQNLLEAAGIDSAAGSDNTAYKESAVTLKQAINAGEKAKIETAKADYMAHLTKLGHVTPR